MSDEPDKKSIRFLHNLRISQRAGVTIQTYISHKILIVTDSSKHIQKFVHTLSRDYFDITIVRSGLEASTILKAGQVFDTVMIDLVSFPVSSPMLCQKLREIYTPLQLPILLIVNESKINELDWIFQVGANDILHEPFHPQEVVMRVMTLCRLKKTSLALQSAEMKVLRLQMKPHFLYNVFHTIISYCYDNSQKVAKLLSEFSYFLRNTFDFHGDDEWIELAHELRIVKSYLYITEARFGNQLKITWDIDTHVHQCKIPPFVLQPIIENAIIHAFQSNQSTNLLAIMITLRGQQLQIVVKDNGIGIPEEVISQIKDGTKSTQGLALTNIHSRLLAIAGTGLEIVSELGKGTEVSMCIPQMR